MQTMIRLALLFALAPAFAVSLAAHEGEHWPTPFSAEEIRDAWFEGFWLDTETVTPEGTALRRTSVLAHTETGVSMRDVEIDGAGQPIGEPVEFETTWEDLRRHAEFSRARADRRRHRESTPLGELEGYLFRVDGERTGEVSELFFSLHHPGPPVTFRTVVDGEVVLEARQVARAER